MTNSAKPKGQEPARLNRSSDILKGLRHSAQRWTAEGKGAAVLRWEDVGEWPSTLEELYLGLKSHLTATAAKAASQGVRVLILAASLLILAAFASGPPARSAPPPQPARS